MATHCPIGFDIERLRDHVEETYDRVARDPSGDFHFHRGGRYAVEFLGYDPTELDSIPRLATDRFAGVGNPLGAGPLRPGEIVLDHACGAGTDLLLAARRVGPTGRAFGVDMTAAMCHCATIAAREAGLAERVEIRQGIFEDLPIATASVDVVLSNGVVNLAPDKKRVFDEIARVLKPGGRLYLADVVVARELTLEARSNPDLWAACIGGAMERREFIDLAAEAGLEDAYFVAEFDCYAGTSAADKVSADLRVRAATLRAAKP